MTGNNTHVVAVWVGFAGHSSPQGPPGGRGFTRTFAPKEVSPYDWQVGGGGGCQLGAQLGLWDWRLDSFSRASVMGLRTVWQQGPKRVSPDRQWELLAP